MIFFGSVCLVLDQTQWPPVSTSCAQEDVNVQELKEDRENLVDLESFTEGSILHHVRKRYEQNRIYTV